MNASLATLTTFNVPSVAAQRCGGPNVWHTRFPNRARALATKCSSQGCNSKQRVIKATSEDAVTAPMRLHPRRAAVSAIIATPLLAATSAFADEVDTPPPTAKSGLSSYLDRVPGFSVGRMYLDISIDGEPGGRVVIECADTVGGQRLLALAKGESKDGAQVSYMRRADVVDLQSEGGTITTTPIRMLSKLDGSSVGNIPGGEDGKTLRFAVKDEKAESKAEGAGSVWLRAFDDNMTDPEVKLVARRGKLVQETELPPPPPNGTALTLCTGACGATLAETHAYAGRVVEGADLLKMIGELPTVAVNRKLQYGSNLVDIAQKRENRTFRKVQFKAGAQ